MYTGFIYDFGMKNRKVVPLFKKSGTVLNRTSTGKSEKSTIVPLFYKS